MDRRAVSGMSLPARKNVLGRVAISGAPRDDMTRQRHAPVSARPSMRATVLVGLRGGGRAGGQSELAGSSQGLS